MILISIKAEPRADQGSWYDITPIAEALLVHEKGNPSYTYRANQLTLNATSSL